MSNRAADNDIREFLLQHAEWSRDGAEISRTFLLRDFNEALGFVVRIGLLSEVADHHPDIDIRWNKVTMTLTTHSASALTTKDTELAAAFDVIARPQT